MKVVLKFIMLLLIVKSLLLQWHCDTAKLHIEILTKVVTLNSILVVVQHMSSILHVKKHYETSEGRAYNVDEHVLLIQFLIRLCRLTYSSVINDYILLKDG